MRSVHWKESQVRHSKPVKVARLNWETARKAALERDEHQCRRCSRPATDVHHRRIKGMGGTSDPEINFGLSNLLSACRECHSHVHLHPAESYESGWLVHSWDAPEDVELKNPEVPLF